MTMKIKLKKRSSRQLARMSGLTTVELVIVVAVIMIITAVALPSFLQAYQTYQLTDAATQVAGVLKFTRYEAIRLNVGTVTPPLPAQVRQVLPTTTSIFTDSNYSGTVQPTDNQVLLSGNANLVPAGTAPNIGGLAAAVGAGALTNVSLTTGSIAFDARGAVTPAAVDVLYIGNLALPNLGNRAVVVFPSGSVQIWSADVGGNWHQLN